MISKKGVELIKSFEGFAPLEYTCVAGKRTIGYGHVLGPEEKYVCGVCEREAEQLLKQDLDIAEKAVEKLVEVPLSDCQKDALVSFVFNVGIRAFQKSTLLKELNAGRYDRVPRQLQRWIYVNGRPCGGLIRRRQAEAALFAKPAGRKRPVFL